ncbi:MAG: Unknown protein [uncultured Thiotrichaceae bacterium]|uniref:Uncharacterized protein n=1 Tax=uncultured Thiotrichaceae bacterium TaxID=298394 RepID=A0A6S6U470_9GAMM|nr:MAG: Unknown protein [uncultured Thiotrichaceae bacterium]
MLKKKPTLLLLALFIFSFASNVYADPRLSLNLFGPGVQDGSAPFNEDGNCATASSVAAAGDDCGESNNQVRSQDTVIFNWSITASEYTAGQADPQNVILEQTLDLSTNAKVSFERIPARCTPAGDGGTNPASSITQSGSQLTLLCNVGELKEGQQISFSTVAKVSGESWNGETFKSNQQVYSNADNGSSNAISSVAPEIGPISISARPRMDLISSPFRGYYVYGKKDVGTGFGLENGYYTFYNFRIATHKKSGTEAVTQPISFTSELTATKQAENGVDYTASGMEYYMTQCIYNPSGWAGEVYGKESYGASNLTTYPLERKVIQSGTCTYNRDAAAGNAGAYTMTVSGADLSGDRFPTEAIGGADLSAGPYYYVNMRVQFFIPTRVIDDEDGDVDGVGSIYIKNVLKDFAPVGVSTVPNYGADDEPGFDGTAMSDGSISNNIAPAYNYQIVTKGTFSNYYYKDDLDTGVNYRNLDGVVSHNGVGMVGPGQSFIDKVHFGNNGSVDLENPEACMAFDNTVMKLTDRGNTRGTPGTYAYVGTTTTGGFDHTNYIVEYGHADFSGDNPLDTDDADSLSNYNTQTGRYEGNWLQQASARCDDSLTTWVTEQTLRSGSVIGIDDVNVVRARLKDDKEATVRLEPSQYIRLTAPLEVRDNFFGGPNDGDLIPNGTILATFGSARTDKWNSAWTPNDTSADKRPYWPSPETGNRDGDRVTFTRVQSAIDSESLLPVASPGDTSTTIAGKQIVWKVSTAISSILSPPPEVTNVQIIDELPPEATYNKDCTVNYEDADGNVIGTPADVVQYNTDRNGDAKTGYTRLIWNLGTWTANTAIAPRVICTDSDSLAPNGTDVINFSEIKGDGLTGTQTERSDTHTISLEQIGSIQVSKKVEVTLDDVNSQQKYELSFANFAVSYGIEPPTIIDVFPFNNDVEADGITVQTKTNGAVKLSGAPSISWLSGATDGAPLGTWYYTTDAASSVIRDPNLNVSNWVSEAALAGDFSQVTAIKFVSNYDLEKSGDPHQGMTASFTLDIGDPTDPNSANANKPGDSYSNLFTLGTASLTGGQYLRSNTVRVDVASYSVGDLIFADVDGDLKYDASIDTPAPDGITVELRKATDDSLVDSTTTGTKGPGRYLFVDVASGDYYITIPASQFADGAVLEDWDTLVTVAGADDDKNEDLAQDGYTTGTVIANGLRSNVFTLSATAPLPGQVPVGNEPLGENSGGITDTTNDDFSNLTLDIGLKPVFDYGDAPDTYGDAGHGIPETPTVYLGVLTPDTERFPQNTVNGGNDGTGDDQDGKNDEDGIQLLPSLSMLDTRFQVNVSTHNRSTEDATLMAWIDFDKSGTFDANEATSVPVTSGGGGVKELVWDNIAAGTIQAGTIWMRIRLSTDAYLTADNAKVALFDGEVEDYSFTVVEGVKVSGSVFNDSNVSGGIKESAENGLSNVTVVLYDAVNTRCMSTKTDAEGYYQFTDVTTGPYTLYEAANESVANPAQCPPAARDLVGYRSTTVNMRSITVSNADIIKQDFGDVLPPMFSPDHSNTVLPNNVVHYAHKFTTRGNGNVSFTSDNSVPASVGWSSVLYRDIDCNGQLDGADGNAAIAASLPVTAGKDICLINKVFAPSNMSNGESFINKIRADYDFNGNTVAGVMTLEVTDLTKANSADTEGGVSRLELRKTVENTSQGTAETETQNEAKPTNVLKYRIYYRNTGTAGLTELVIKDTVPIYTVLKNSPVCGIPLPATLTSCTPSVNGDDITWSFLPTDTLKGGDGGHVSYEVEVK